MPAAPPHEAKIGAGKGMSFASFRRFWAVAANRNSSLAPLGPRRREQCSLRMRFRCPRLRPRITQLCKIAPTRQRDFFVVPVVRDPPKALRASRVFFRRSVTPAFRANFSASAWVSVAPFASISLKNPSSGERDMRERRLSARQSRASPPHIASREADELRQFPQILGGGGQ